MINAAYYPTRAYANRVAVAIERVTESAPGRTPDGRGVFPSTAIARPQLDAICSLLDSGTPANRITRAMVERAMGAQS